MKALLLASALIAAPLIAQDTQPAPQPNDPAVTQANDAAAATAAAAQPAPAPGPGQTVVFKQPQSVDQAFPPPAAKESYPWCSKTVTDGCKQRYDPK